MAKVSNEVFCKAWKNSDSVTEVAEEFSITTTAATARAAALRKMGVKLKSFPRGRKAGSGIDVDALNAMLAEGDDNTDTDNTDTDTPPPVAKPAKPPRRPVKLVAPEGDDED